MIVLTEPFASVYDDRRRLGVILARGRGGFFEAYAADEHSLGLFPSPRKAAAAITTTRPWVAQTTAEDKPERSQQSALVSGAGADQVRFSDQPQDREGDGSHRAGDATRARRRGDRVRTVGTMT